MSDTAAAIGPAEDGLRAISVRQPWAWAIAHGPKRVENRTQIGTWRKLAGTTVALHTGGKLADGGADAIPQLMPTLSRAWWATMVPRLPKGAYLGLVDVLDVHAEEGGCCAPWGEASYIDADGRKRTEIVHLALDNVRLLDEPEPGPGSLGPFRVPEHLVDEILTNAKPVP